MGVRTDGWMEAGGMGPQQCPGSWDPPRRRFLGAGSQAP